MDNTQKNRSKVQLKVATMLLKAIGADIEVPQQVKDQFKQETTEPTKKGTLKACLLDGQTVIDLLEIRAFLEQVISESVNFIKDHDEVRKEVSPMEILAQMLGEE